MSKQISMTLPDIVVEAMEKKGAQFELTAGEFLKQRVLMSAQGADVPLALGDVVLQLRGKACLAVFEQVEMPLGGVSPE